MSAAENIAKPDLAEMILDEGKSYVLSSHQLLLCYPTIIDEKLIEKAIQCKNPIKGMRCISHAIEEEGGGERHSIVLLSLISYPPFIILPSALRLQGHYPRTFCIADDHEYKLVQFWMENIKKNNIQKVIVDGP